MNRMETETWDGDEVFGEFIRRVGADLIPKIRASEAMVSIMPSTETDAKFAVEMGLALMLEKPIIMLVRPGQAVPKKVAGVADEIVEIDLTRTEDVRRAVIAAMDRLADRGLL